MKVIKEICQCCLGFTIGFGITMLLFKDVYITFWEMCKNL